jgi:hypothetical protein
MADDETEDELATEDPYTGFGFDERAVATANPRVGPPLERPGSSTPLESEEPEDTIPPAPLWAMKDRRHFWGVAGHGDADRIRARIGEGDATVYFIDDGRDHCMVGRRVGSVPEGSVYCLVGRVPLELYQDVSNGSVPTTEVFSRARDLELCAVFEDEALASDVYAVAHYRRSSDVPPEYLPPSPFIEFTDDLPSEE